MPIYAYRCKNGHEFEKLVALADADQRPRCPECRSSGEKVFRAFNDANSSKRKDDGIRRRQRFTNW